MTFTKYVALMLLGFTMFVGYQAYTKHEKCIEMRSQVGMQDTEHERRAALAKYVGVCGPWGLTN